MKGEQEKKNNEDNRSYCYAMCKNCGIKLHIYASECWKCGKTPENRHYQENNNPKDAIYSKELNSVKKCVLCYKVSYLGKDPCVRVCCFAKGIGNCGACRDINPDVFECCQETMKADPPPTREDWQNLLAMMGGIGKPKQAQAAALAAFENDIPY